MPAIRFAHFPVPSPAVPLAGTLAPPGTPRKPIHYPDSDGKPMAENTKQARWIFTLYGNLSALFRDSADVFVAADNLWYPVEGEVVLLKELDPDMADATLRECLAEAALRRHLQRIHESRYASDDPQPRELFHIG